MSVKDVRKKNEVNTKQIKGWKPRFKSTQGDTLEAEHV